VVSSHEATNRTGPTLLEIDDRAYNETASIIDPLDPEIVPSCGVQGLYQDV
jgi:hypothetical protein